MLGGDYNRQIAEKILDCEVDGFELKSTKPFGEVFSFISQKLNHVIFACN